MQSKLNQTLYSSRPINTSLPLSSVRQQNSNSVGMSYCSQGYRLPSWSEWGILQESRVTHSLPHDIQYVFPQFAYRNGTTVVGMLCGPSVKLTHGFVTPIVHWLLNKLFRIPPEGLSHHNYTVNSLSVFHSHNCRHSINAVTKLLSIFVTVPLSGCLTVQLYATNLLTLSHQIQL
jgi:hypothetical protein